MKQILQGSLFLLYTLLFLNVSTVVAEDIHTTSGWNTSLSEVVGDDTSCGPSEVNLELYIRDLQTNDPAIVSSAMFGVFNSSNGALTGLAEGTGPEVGRLCFNPDTQYFAYDIEGGLNYHNFATANMWVTPGAIPRGKHMRATVWVTPSSVVLPEYIESSPVNVTVNSSPEFQVMLNSFPATYGATGLSRVLLFVYDYDLEGGGGRGTRRASTQLSVSTGTGLVTVPSQTLADGVYTWAYYLSLNGSHDAGGVIPIQELSSGYGGARWPFILDTTAPTIVATNTPSVPILSDPVTITATATDALSGIDEVRVYVDDTLNQTCTYASVNDAVCTVTVGPFGPGTTHEYYAVATDAAGNSATGSVSQFLILDNEPPIANAGPDKEITLPTTVSAPSGVSISDPEYEAFKDYYWTFVSGPSVPTIEFVDDDRLYPTFSNLTQAGEYVFRLSVMDHMWATGTDEMKVTVNENPTPTGWIAATPNVVDAIDTSMITWGSSNADECIVTSTVNDDMWSALNNGDGAVTTPLTVDTSYVLTCDGVLVASAPITVNPDVTITVSSKVVQSGGYVDVTWNTNGNDEAACTLAGGGLTNALFNGTGTGTHRVPDIIAKTTFTLTCGTQTDAIDVEVKPVGWES